MAKVTATSKSIESKADDRFKITLDLSRAEAMQLRVIVGAIAGPADIFTSKLHDQLVDAGVVLDLNCLDGRSGNLYFVKPPRTNLTEDQFGKMSPV